jgi:hypothetical protein
LFQLRSPTSHSPVASTRPPPLRNEARRDPRRARDVRPAGVEGRVRDRRRCDIRFTEGVDRFIVGSKEIALPNAAVFEVPDGKIAAWRDYFDMARYQRQLG